MSTAVARAAGQPAGAQGVADQDPDLVAYWKFDEGGGFLARDATGRGHDLRLTAPPRWMVRAARCGLEAGGQRLLSSFQTLKKTLTNPDSAK